MRGLSNAITIGILITIAISLAVIIYFTTSKYTETEYVNVMLIRATSPKCIGTTCHVLLDLKIKNYSQKLYTIRSLYFSIITENNVTQRYFGYNPKTGLCENIPTIDIIGENCESGTCYLSMCHGNVTVPDLSERTYSIRIDFDKSDFITEIAVIVVMYDAIGNEYRVSSNSVQIQ